MFEYLGAKELVAYHVSDVDQKKRQQQPPKDNVKYEEILKFSISPSKKEKKIFKINKQWDSKDAQEVR